MADKELRRMNRTELIEIIYALQQNERSLRAENEALRSQLDDKLLRIDRAGSIAEASLSLNHVFEDAEAAARQYLDSLRSADERAEEIVADARRRADEMLMSAQAQVNEAAERIRQTEQECDSLREKTEQEVKQQRDAFVQEIRQLVRMYPELAARMQENRK